MTDQAPENQTTQPPAADLATVAAKAKGGPLSTVTIMRALFEAKIALSNASGKPTNLSAAIALDSGTAKLNMDLNKNCPQLIDRIRNTIADIQNRIDGLSSIKTAAQIAANYNDLVNPMRIEVDELNGNLKDQISELKAFNTDMQQTFNNSGKGDISPQLAQLLKAQHLMRVSAEKTRTHIEAITLSVKKLEIEVTRTAAASGVKQDAPKTSGTPPTLE